MLKNIYIKLTKVSPSAGPFNIYDQWGILIAENVSREDLINGVGYLLADNVTLIKLVSVGDCSYEKIMTIVPMTTQQFFTTPTTEISTGCVWRHLLNPNIYNTFYGAIKPYILEHPFSYPLQDEILQSFKDYSRVYQYSSNGVGSYSSVDRINVNNVYFNKMVVYNDQQCSGLLLLVPKPTRNLREYMRYPLYNSDSRSILYTKSDNFYQTNDIYDVLNDKSNPIFNPSCESLSLDKELNQGNMIYTQRSFNKAQLRAKDTRVRMILDDRGDTQIISQIVINSNQISYK